MEILSLNGKNLEFGSFIFWKLIFLMNEEICK